MTATFDELEVIDDEIQCEPEPRRTRPSSATAGWEAAARREAALRDLPSFIKPHPDRVFDMGTEDDWPSDLAPHDRAYLRNRAVAPRVAAARGVRTIATYDDLERFSVARGWGPTWEATAGRRVVTHIGVRDQMSLRTEDGQSNSAMLIPLFSATDPDTPQVHQIKLVMPRPRIDDTGSPHGVLKFDLPIGVKRDVGVGSLPADVHPSLQDDGRCPMVWTEGQAKGDAILSAALREGLDVLPVTFTGVTMPFHAAGKPENPGRKPKLTRAITETLPLAGRVVYLCWDADWRTNRNVTKALMTTGELLEDSGAIVFVVDVPMVGNDTKTGVDDYLADALDNGVEVSLAPLLAAAIELPTARAETLRYRHDDVGRAERMAAEVLRTKSHLYNATRQAWMEWTGTHWQTADRGSAVELAKRLALRDPEDKGACSHNAVRAAMNLATSTPGVTVVEQDMDRDRCLLNTSSGTVDLRTSELLPHNPDDLVSRCTPCGFDPEQLTAPDYGAPTWDLLLKTVIPNSETRDWFQRAMGMAVIGELREDLMLKLHGPGGNGKSTVFMAIQRALEPYARTASSKMFTDRDGAKDHQLADLVGVRLFVIPETNEGERMHVSTMKVIAGREKIQARRLYQESFDFFPSHTAVLMTNHMLTIGSNDKGTWRRIRLVPFLVDLEKHPEKKIADVDMKLAMELPGILAWLIDGARKYVDSGWHLGTCEEVEKATNKYRAEQDVLGSFVSDELVVDAVAKVESTQLYPAYSLWCIENGYRPTSRKRFFAAMREAGFIGEDAQRASNGKDWVHGLALKSPKKHERDY